MLTPAEGKPTIKPTGIESLAQDLLPRVRVADGFSTGPTRRRRWSTSSICETFAPW